jgi:chromosome partitioning protein
MKILAVSSEKGGVAKTTISVHLAHAAYDKGLKVLLVDFDTQGNAGMMFEPPDLSKTFLSTAALFDEKPSNMPIEFVKPNFGIIRADKEALTMVADSKTESAEFRPLEALKQHANSFDICIVDSAPSRAFLLYSSLVLADYVLTPVKMGKFELDGFAELISDITNIQKSGINSRIKHLGSIPVKINTRSSKQMEMLNEFKATYKKSVLDLCLPEREAVQVAINEGRPVWNNVRGASHKKTATEWRDACDAILNMVIKG